MNCSVCGDLLRFDRVVFHCSCGAFVHAYCWEKHVLQVHSPAFEIGSINLNGEFKVQEQPSDEDEVKKLESAMP